MANRFLQSIRLVLDAAASGQFRVALIGGFALAFYGVQRATGDVDFLADGIGSDALHSVLLEGGAVCLHRSEDAANYGPGTSELSPVDFIYARRERALAMLARAKGKRVGGEALKVPVVDAEALIGLKLQGIVNEPSRRHQDEADIRALLKARVDQLDEQVLRDYYRVFEREWELDELLAELRKR